MRGLLLAVFDYSNAREDEFHDWYDLEHVPEREAIAGFGACERWLDIEKTKTSIATYDLDSADVLRGAAYNAVGYNNPSAWSKRMTGICNIRLRFEGSQIKPGDEMAPAGAHGLLLNAMNVTAEAEDEFNAWYDEEHLPALASVPGTLSARRYRSAEDVEGTHRYVAIYHLIAPEVTQSDAWNEAVDTPWTAQMRPHFRDRIRILTRAYIRAV